MAGRTTKQHERIYISGYDMSGYTHSIGTLGWRFDTENMAALTDAVHGGLPNQAHITVGTINGIFATDTGSIGMHAVFNAPSTSASRIIMIAFGDKTAPVAGVPAWVSRNYQTNYLGAAGEVLDTVTMEFGEWDVANLVEYQRPWGHLLLPLTAKTAANSSTADHDHGAATTKGGFMCYHVTTASSAGHTATIKVQHSATDIDGNFVDLGGCTTGVIDVGTAPVAGILETTAVTTTVNQYIRWQILLGTATSVTFALAFVRNI